MSGRTAFGAPGIEPRWTHSTKEGIGTAYHTSCRVWFTLSHGIVMSFVSLHWSLFRIAKYVRDSVGDFVELPTRASCLRTAVPIHRLND